MTPSLNHLINDLAPNLEPSPNTLVPAGSVVESSLNHCTLASQQMTWPRTSTL